MMFGKDVNDAGMKVYFAIPKTEKSYIDKMLKKDEHIYEMIKQEEPIRFYFDYT